MVDECHRHVFINVQITKTNKMYVLWLRGKIGPTQIMNKKRGCTLPAIATSIGWQVEKQWVFRSLGLHELNDQSILASYRCFIDYWMGPKMPHYKPPKVPHSMFLFALTYVVVASWVSLLFNNVMILVQWWWESWFSIYWDTLLSNVPLLCMEKVGNCEEITNVLGS